MRHSRSTVGAHSFGRGELPVVSYCARSTALAINDDILHPEAATDASNTTSSSASISRAGLLKAGAIAAAGLSLGLNVRPATAASTRVEVGASNTSLTWFVRTN